MAGIGSVNGDVNNGPHLPAGDVFNLKTVHQLVVSHSHNFFIHLGDNAVAADLLDVADPAAVQLETVSLLQALADGMGGGAFSQSGVRNQLFVRQVAVVDAAD